MLDWTNPKCVEWMKNASEYTGYHQKLSEILRFHAGEGGSLCEIGCGIGLVDFCLAPFYDEISCYDISSRAVSLVNSEASIRGINNIRATEADTGALEGKWDKLFAVFHGKPVDFADKFRFMVRDALVIATHDLSRVTYENPVYASRRNNDCEAMKKAFEDRGVPYELSFYCLSFGQPLKSYDDAEDYCKTYFKLMPGESSRDCVKRLASETGDKKYPLFIPNEKHLAVFTVKPEA